MKVEFVPWQSLEIRSLNQFPDVETFIDVVVIPVPLNTQAQTGLLWSEGVLFRHAPLPSNSVISQLHVNGKIIWDNVDFALMPKYERQLHPRSKPMVVIEVVDMSGNSLFKEVGRWLHTHYASKQSGRRPRKTKTD